MTVEQIDAVIAPKNESKELVLQWISGHGLTGVVNARGNAVHLNATVSQAQDLLGAEYSSYSKEFGIMPSLI
jgi:tripeptidyl-peptidase I